MSGGLGIEAPAVLRQNVRVATVVSFHAHPDDEALLTGGTLARLSAEGHRVVVVVACDGIMGPAASGRTAAPGGRSRLDELRDSASVLGVARVVHLGYADSGHGPVLYPDPPDRQRFVRADVSEAAQRLASVMSQERADLLLSYDNAGGYGHRDHVAVHQVGRRAASLADVRLLEATLPRELVVWIVRLLQLVRLLVRFDLHAETWGTPRSQITHHVNARKFAARKRAALAAHKSQIGAAGRGSRAFWVLVRLPVPVFGLLLGGEWFVEPGPSRASATADGLPSLFKVTGRSSG
jgi:LmbE family N-acetylglucosaminyl deacetylase